MKVKELIAQLKKMDPEAEVIFQDHDNGDDELNGTIDNVAEVDSPVLIARFGGPVVALQ